MLSLASGLNAGKTVTFYFLDLPHLVEALKSTIVPFVVLHKVALPTIVFLVLFLHVAGVVKHHFFDSRRRYSQDVGIMRLLVETAQIWTTSERRAPEPLTELSVSPAD